LRLVSPTSQCCLSCADVGIGLVIQSECVLAALPVREELLSVRGRGLLKQTFVALRVGKNWQANVLQAKLLQDFVDTLFDRLSAAMLIEHRGLELADGIQEVLNSIVPRVLLDALLVLRVENDEELIALRCINLDAGQYCNRESFVGND